MKIWINGETQDCQAGTTLQGLIDMLEIEAQGVVVERNGLIHTSVEFSGVVLQEEDRLEIVHFLGGG